VQGGFHGEIARILEMNAKRNMYKKSVVAIIAQNFKDIKGPQKEV
jgi:hypothetical protein